MATKAANYDGYATISVGDSVSIISTLPDCIEVQELDKRQWLMIRWYKLTSMLPVAVTFCIYVYLFTFYTYVSENTH